MSRVCVRFRSPAVISFRASFLNFVGLFVMTAWRVLKFKMNEAISNDGGDM